MSKVMAAELCPSIRCTALTLAPADTANDAAVCRRSCGVTRGAPASLKRAGTIVPNGAARQGNRAEYALTLDPMTTVVPTITRNGTGRPVTIWSVVHRQDPRPQPSPTGTVPLSPTGTVPLRPIETVPHQPHRNGGSSPTETVPL